jgi:hypothetical protein
MINTNVSELLGIECHHLDEEGNVAVIDTPFLFYDGDSIPVYVELENGNVRFFDDGEIILRFGGFGFRVHEPGGTKFIEEIVAPCGVALNDAGEFEIKALRGEIPAAFAQYITAMLSIIRWEQEDNARVDERRRQAVTTGAVGADALSA